MVELNLPSFPLKLRSDGEQRQVFDIIRKKYVRLTPEEWVRQHFIWYLIQERNYPASLCIIEGKLIFNGLTRRSDILVCRNDGSPAMVIECKAPSVKLSQDVMDQVVRYNWILKAKFIVLTNGLRHLVCTIDYKNEKYEFLKEIPPVEDL